MNESARETVVERFIAIARWAIYWSAFVCLAVGLGLWTTHQPSRWGGLLLIAGLLAMMVLPTLGLFSAIAKAGRERDWIVLLSTLIVLAILLAFTLRDAARLK